MSPLPDFARWLPFAPILLVVFAYVTFRMIYRSRPAPSGRSLLVMFALVIVVILLARYETPMFRHQLLVPALFISVAFWIARYTIRKPVAPKLEPLWKAIQSGNYESALKLCDGLPPSPETDFFRGAALYHLRRLNESEAALRASLAKEKRLRAKCLVLNQLGNVLMEQGRTEEAIQSFEESVRLNPARGGALRGQAEVYLRGRFDLDKALKLAKKAVEIDRRQPAPLKEVSLSISCAALAWALAANGQDDAARQTVREALAQCPPDNVPQTAEDHYLAGHAMLAIGDREAASGYFRRCAELEPAGNFGYLAGQELGRLG